MKLHPAKIICKLLKSIKTSIRNALYFFSGKKRVKLLRLRDKERGKIDGRRHSPFIIYHNVPTLRSMWLWEMVYGGVYPT